MTSRALSLSIQHGVRLAFAAALLTNAFPRAAPAEDLFSANYRLRGEIAPTSTPLSNASGADLRAVGGSLGSSTALGTSIGEETGLILVGGLWPALVGAAFDQDRDLVPNVTDNCTVVRNMPLSPEQQPRRHATSPGVARSCPRPCPTRRSACRHRASARAPRALLRPWWRSRTPGPARSPRAFSRPRARRRSCAGASLEGCWQGHRPPSRHAR